MTRTSIIAPLLLVAASSAALAGCGAKAPKPQAIGATESAHTDGGVQVLDVTGDDSLRFEQTALHAHTGMVRLIFHAGKVPHNLTFTDGPMGMTQTVRDATTSLTMTFSKPGTYHFVCTIHPGMAGMLTIS